jgi:hypothetical protein
VGDGASHGARVARQGWRRGFHGVEKSTGTIEQTVGVGNGLLAALFDVLHASVGLDEEAPVGAHALSAALCRVLVSRVGLGDAAFGG